MSSHAILTFAVAFFVFAASPGPDNITIVSKTIADGPKAGVVYALGMVTSILFFVLLAKLGLSIATSLIAEHLVLVRWAAAAYLLYVGVSLVRSVAAVEARDVAKVPLPRLFLLGMAFNMSNPKMPAFYLALLPAVIGVRELNTEDALAMVAVILVVETIVIAAHVLIADKARSALRNPTSLRWMNRGAGVLMIASAVLSVVKP
jgi:threonine/homoserine/homoserine lactone efflux protein